MLTILSICQHVIRFSQPLTHTAFSTHNTFAQFGKSIEKCLVRKEKNIIGSAWPSFHKSDPSCHCSTGAFQNTQQHKQHQHDFLPTCSKVFSSALPSPTVSIFEIYNLRLCNTS